MESYDDHYDKFFPWIKLAGIGATGAAAMSYFAAVADEVFPARLILSDKDTVADSQDKIAELGLTNDEMIYRAVNMSTSIIPLMKRRDNLIGMDFAEIPRTPENVGRIYVGFGESLDAENNSLAAVKKALQSPLFLEDISNAKTVWFVFFGKVDFISMLATNFVDCLQFPTEKLSAV